MIVWEIESGLSHKARIFRCSDEDLKTVARDKKRFSHFNWKAFRSCEVYCIKLNRDKSIMGLIGLIDHTDPMTNAIEIKLLEVSSENIGRNKKFRGIAGCLLAFACRESFKRGHMGELFLIPKTGLIEHYSNMYGFIHFPFKSVDRPEGLMFLSLNESRKLIQQYIDYESD